MVMSDRIGIMRAGRIVQVGTPDEIYTAPADEFVAGFMGEVNLFPGTLAEDGSLHATELGVPLKTQAQRGRSGAPVTLMVRPESIRFVRPGETADCVLVGEVVDEYGLGSRIQYAVRVGPTLVIVERLREDRYVGPVPGPVTVGWNVLESRLIAREAGGTPVS
jgi:spermidine/putrescine transport system ATP-binding protein